MLGLVNVHRNLYIGICEIKKAEPSGTTMIRISTLRYRVYVLNTISLHVTWSAVLEIVNIYAKQRYDQN
jgi:hypothetical protein